MAGFIFGLFITLLTGYFFISVIEREMALRFRILFAIPLGFTINSVLYFLYLFCNINNFKAFCSLEIIMLIILALLYYNEEKPNLSKHKFKKLSNWFYLLNIYAILIFLKYFINNPMGSWDGFRIWNTKAAFLALDTPLWQNIFSLPHFMSHNDYPLMLPSTIARLWNYTGGENFAVNITIAIFFTFGLVYLLFQALEYFKSEKIALAITSVFMILETFLVNGAAQCADIPLAYMYLCSITCLFLYSKKEKFSYIALATIFAAASAWTKNEGFMFMCIFLSVILSWLLFTKKFKNAGKTAIIALPLLGGLIAFKKITGNENDLVLGLFMTKSYNYIFDFNRYIIIAKTFISTILTQFSLLLVLVFLCTKGFRIKEQNKTPFLLSVTIFILCCVGYIAVYVMSPHDINWLVENSIDRIILQILPIFLLLFGINLRIGKPDSLK